MVYKCCVRGCKSNLNPVPSTVSFHRFPPGTTFKEAERRRLWIEAVSREDISDYKYARICGRHFTTGKPAKFSEIDAPNWIPTLLLEKPNTQVNVVFITHGKEDELLELSEGYDPAELIVFEEPEPDKCDENNNLMLFENGASNSDSFEFDVSCVGSVHAADTKHVSEAVKRIPCEKYDNSRKFMHELPASPLQMDVEELLEEWSEEWLDYAVNEETNDELTKKYETIIAEQQKEIEHLQSVIASYENSISSQALNLKSFEGNDKKTRHFTGLPNYATLKVVYDFVKRGILTFSDILSKDQVFIMVLMRLRLNLCFTTLAYLFKVSLTTICKYFYSGLYSLYQQLRGLVKWPTKEHLRANTPLKFKNVFPNNVITSIIDCFEIFSEKPGNKDAVLKMYSNYKSHYTAKLLISITPFGSVSYISKPYTGRTSDKFITESCGYMSNVDENDLILADRGFTVHKAITDKGALLKVPDSSSKKRQLSSAAVERTRALASVRNEVERLIGALRGKYAVLNGPVPITLLNHEHNGINVFHMAVTVPCALINLCPSIII